MHNNQFDAIDGHFTHQVLHFLLVSCVVLLTAGCGGSQKENPESLIKKLQQDQGMRCDNKKPCRLRAVRLRELDWEGYSFQNVLFENVAFVDIDLRTTVFSNVTFDNVELVATGPGRENLYTGRITDSHIKKLTLRGEVDQKTHSSPVDKRRDESRIEAHVDISDSTTTEELVLESLTFGNQSISKNIIQDIQPKRLFLRNVVTNELWDAVNKKYDEINDELSQDISAMLLRMGSQTQKGDITGVLRALNHPTKNENIPSFRGDDRVISECALERPLPLDLVECSAYVQTILSPVKAFQVQLSSKLEEYYKSTLPRYIQSAAEGFSYAIWNTRDVLGLIVKSDEHAQEIVALVRRSNDAERTAILSLLRDRETGPYRREGWHSIIDEYLSLKEIDQRAEPKDSQDVENNDPMLVLFREYTRKANSLALRRRSSIFSGDDEEVCELDLLEAAQQSSQLETEKELSRQLTEMSESTRATCLSWYRSKAIPYRREMGNPGHEPALQDLWKTVEITEQDLGYLVDNAKRALRDYSRAQERSEREEELARRRAERAEQQRTREAVPLCERLRNRLESTAESCQAGRLYSCQDIALIQREIVMQGCN